MPPPSLTFFVRRQATIKMNFPTDTDYGCEFYTGDADVIGAAVSASDWQALRNGTAAHSFLGFPWFIHGEYFDFFAGAVASVIQQPEVRIHDLRMVAGEDGHWGAYVMPADWVRVVASVPAHSIWLLSQYWRASYLSLGHIEVEVWPDSELLDPLYKLTVLCSEALSRGKAIVLLAI